MTKIIGHRGAAGIALENTLPAFKVAQEIGVDGVEFDVQRTQDGKFVVCHDDDLMRLSGVNAVIHKLTYEQLRAIPLRSGDYVPLLSEVLTSIKNVYVVVEIKVRGYTADIVSIVEQYPHLNITYASPHRVVIAECRKLCPTVPALLREWTHPFTVLTTLKSIDATGLDLNHWLINPLTYWLCKRRHLQLMVYTVDNRFIFWLISTLYPSVWICTNHPQRFASEQRPHQDEAPKSVSTTNHARHS